MKNPRALAWSLACIATAVTCATVTSGASAATIGRAGDYNGDRYRDLAIGAHLATVAGQDSAGAVGITRGAVGLPNPSTHYQRLERSRSWIPGDAVEGEEFGASLASGDLNGDGYSDLATCAPGAQQATSLNIALGSSTGLARSYFAAYESSCEAVVSADFNKDGFADLVTGGSLSVAYGSQGAGTVKGLAFTLLGSADDYAGPLATGDVNGDGYQDLVGQQYIQERPKISVWLGSRNGLPASASQTIDGPEVTSIAVGDLDGDRLGEVVAGAPFEWTDGLEEAGAAYLWHGSVTGIDQTMNAQVITQNTPGVPGASEGGDRFGAAVAVGDTTRDGIAELAIGAPGETLGTSTTWAGMVTIVLGRTGGLNFSAAQGISQNTAEIADVGEKWDQFGRELLFRDLNADGRMDLTVSSPGENNDEGIVHILKGSTLGVTGSGSRLLGPAQFGIARTNANFGSSLG